LERIFEPFAQAPQTLGWSQGGLGIGLSLARSLVELHGGAIRVTSAGKDQGAEFVVSLPTVEAARMVAPPPEARVTIGVQSLRVLVVDDNPDAADTLGEILEAWGHSVRIAHDGRQALDAARDFRPDWLLCDIGLPGLNGYEVAAALRSKPETARIRLVAVTGYGAAGDLNAAREAGFETHLTKPLDPGTLKTLLEVAAPC
jgi:CheY-like chemotaxis protein